MADQLVAYAQLLLKNRAAFESSVVGPVLVWRAPESEGGAEVQLGTDAGFVPAEPAPGQPLVMEVRKRGDLKNAFGMGVTVGRAESNDVVVAHKSVSRFHAYFQKNDRGEWSVVDAESRNGTRLGALKLKANRAARLPERATLRFGGVEMEFFMPSSFVTYLAQQMGRH